MTEKEHTDPLTERIQEFDLADIAQFLRDDIQEAIGKNLLPERKYSVRIARSDNPRISVFTPSAMMLAGEKLFLHDLARAYQRLTWNNASSSMRPNFKLEIKYNGNADSGL